MNRKRKKLLTIYFIYIACIMIISVIWINRIIPPIKFIEKQFYGLHRGSKDKLFFQDLDNDQYKEIILRRTNEIGNCALKIYKSDQEFIQQINLDDALVNNSVLFYSDIDGDSLMEINAFTQSKDSVFLSTIEYRTKDIIVDRQFIAEGKIIDNEEDFYAGPGHAVDINLDGFQELIFQFNGYFSEYPRKIFIYYPKKDKLISTPHLNAKFDIWAIVDLNDDKIPELVLTNHASANNDDSIRSLSDHFSWLIILDNELNFYSKPVKGLGRNSRIQVTTLSDHGSSNMLYIVGEYNHGIRKKPYSFILNNEGNLIDSLEIKEGKDITSAMLKRYHGNIYLIDLNRIFKLNRDLHFENFLSVSDRYFFLDIYELNTFSNSVFIFKDYYLNEYIFSDSRRKFHFDFDIPIRINKIETIDQPDNSQLFYFIGHEGYMVLKGIDHPLKSLILPILILVYLISSVIFFGITYIVNLILKEKQHKKLIMQLDSLNYQFDTHFIYNALNSISSFVLQGDKFTAHDYISKFSLMLGNSLNHIQNIQLQLDSEIQFSEYYLELQKLRFKDNLEFSILVDPKVNRYITVPKSIIFSFIQNSIKHCIGKANPLTINIEISRNNDTTLVLIKDNGPGEWDASSIKTFRKGGSLHLIENYVKLHNQQSKNKTSFTILNKHTIDGMQYGTVVDIKFKDETENTK